MLGELAGGATVAAVLDHRYESMSPAALVLGAMREEARMLSTELNKTLTQIGPGTQMGTLMRRYWLPALLLRLPSRTGRRCGCGCWARISSRSATRPARSA